MNIGLGSQRGASSVENDELISLLKSEEYTYHRSSFTSAPLKKSEFKKTGIPFLVSVTVLPAEEERVPQIDDVPRCKACKAYLSPYCEVVPPGYRWSCSICRAINDVATPLHSYGAYLKVFSPKDNAVNNRKACNNPVLTKDVVEFPSGSEKTPPPFVYLFAIEATADAIERGVFSSVLEKVARIIPFVNDPHDRAEICIVLFGSSVQVVRLGGDAIAIDTVNEVDGALPLLMESDYVVPIKKIRNTLEKTIEEIKNGVYRAEKESKNNFGLALKVASHILDKGGCVFAFLSTIPSVGAAEIKPGSSEAKTHTGFFEKISEELLRKNIGVNLFVLSNRPVEIPVMLPIIEKTGGDVRYYPAYLGQHPSDSLALERDLTQYVSSDSGTNAYCRIRVPESVSIKKYWGVHAEPDGLVKLSVLRRGKTFSFEIDYEEDLVFEGITFQIAVIFNTSEGKRVVRLINFVISLGPTAVDPLGIVHAVALKSIDKECAEKGTGGALALRIATDCMGCIGVQGTMGAFPRLIYGLIKNKVFRLVSSDLKGVIMHGIRNHPVKVADAMVYPTLVRIDEEFSNEEGVVLPLPLKLSSSVISTDGTYFLDSGIIAYIFTGDSSMYRAFEGLEGRVTIPEEKKYERVRNIVDYMVGGRAIEPVFYSVHQTGHSFLLETFQSMLLEDGSSSVSASYQDFSNKFLSKGYANSQ